LFIFGLSSNVRKIPCRNYNIHSRKPSARQKTGINVKMDKEKPQLGLSLGSMLVDTQTIFSPTLSDIETL